MLGANQGLKEIIDKWSVEDDLLCVVWHNYILHQESLVVKSLKMPHVTKIILTTVNWIRANALLPLAFTLQSGLATAYHVSPNRPVFNIPLPCTNFPISSFTTSKNLLFSLPLLLFPSNFISIIFLPRYSWSLLMTCLYHLSLPSLTSFLTILP